MIPAVGTPTGGAVWLFTLFTYKCVLDSGGKKKSVKKTEANCSK